MNGFQNKKLKNMKKRHLLSCMAIALLAGQMALLTSLASCDNDDTIPSTEPIDKTEIFVERLTVLLNDITTLLNGATFGEKKGEYPVSSKKILEDQISSLSETLTKVREGIKKLSNSDMDNIILETKKIEAKFKSSVRTEDFTPIAAELNVYGKNGGYIDFGIHNEYSDFGNSGEQEFTIDFWVKLTDVDNVLKSFVFLVSTFTDEGLGNGEHDRKGWNINLHMGNLRATYAMGTSDLFEPGFGFNNVNQWVHIALVTNEKGVDGDTNEGKPVMMKMYVNGILSKSEQSNQPNSKPYRPNDLNVPMVAFTGMSTEGYVEGGKSTNGCIKHFHIWKTAKSQTEIQNTMNNPETVTGSESDLVCGWDLSKTVSDDNDIKDLTGQFSAKLVGDCRWVKK
jgi:hypothetical protein